jgi:hypothetical protein
MTRIKRIASTRYLDRPVKDGFHSWNKDTKCFYSRKALVYVSDNERLNIIGASRQSWWMMSDDGSRSGALHASLWYSAIWNAGRVFHWNEMIDRPSCLLVFLQFKIAPVSDTLPTLFHVTSRFMCSSFVSQGHSIVGIVSTTTRQRWSDNEKDKKGYISACFNHGLHPCARGRETCTYMESS